MAESPAGAVNRKACRRATPLEEEARMMAAAALVAEVTPWTLLAGACMEDAAVPVASSVVTKQTREAAAEPAAAVVPWLLQRDAQEWPAGAAVARWSPKGKVGGRRYCHSNRPSSCWERRP